MLRFCAQAHIIKLKGVNKQMVDDANKASLNLSIDKDLIKRLKVYATINDTSVSAVMTELAEKFLNDSEKGDSENVE